MSEENEGLKPAFKTTWYFDNVVPHKHPEAARLDWVEQVLNSPETRIADPHPGRERLNSTSLRETSRALGGRCLLAIRDGDTTTALEMLDAIIGMSALLITMPDSTHQMIGVDLRGIGASGFG
jgi:hypothetical protein